MGGGAFPISMNETKRAFALLFAVSLESYGTEAIFEMRCLLSNFALTVKMGETIS